MHEITYSALYTWAAQQPNDRAIGLANDCGKCPVAQFLAQTTGERWDVAPMLGIGALPYARNVRTGELTPLPGWLQLVVADVDRGIFGFQSIGKARFLAILTDHKPAEVPDATH